MSIQMRTQRDQRRDMVAKDQFGRSWLLAIEIKTGDPTGSIDRCSWADPLLTPQRYLKVPKDEHGQAKWGSITVDMGAWLNDVREADQEWKRNLWDIGQQKYGVKFDAKNAEDDDYLMHLAGPKPWPPVAALQAAAAGDQRLLGLVPMDRDSRKMLGLVALEDYEHPAPEVVGDPTDVHALTYQEFLKDHLKRGIELPQIYTLWRERKAALAL